MPTENKINGCHLGVSAQHLVFPHAPCTDAGVIRHGSNVEPQAVLTAHTRSRSPATMSHPHACIDQSTSSRTPRRNHAPINSLSMLLCSKHIYTSLYK
ncbi:hypothetical protein DAI22_03g231100 [Oryza sativa Japonica Group]|nr:hypothetical protein DAI22_03g231100 [Oryza sativa Japonica Group]